MSGQTPISRDITRITLAVVFIGMLIASNFWILRPFLTAIIWATMIVVATWPVMLGLQKRLKGKRGLAVAVMTVVLLLVIIVPLSLAIIAIIGNVDKISGLVKWLTTITLPPLPKWLVSVPIAGPKIAERWQKIAALSPEEITGYIMPYAQMVARWVVAQAGNVGLMFLQFLLTVIISAILYATGEKAASGVLIFLRRLAGHQGEEAAVLAAKAIRGVALGIVLTALMQSLFAGIGLAVTGVPAAPVLTAVMFMLCLAQVGPGLVLIPAIIWTYSSNGPLLGTVLLIFSIIAGTADNFIRPVLIKKGADLPLILIFTGVIGGLIAFGIMGLFIGPVVLAVTHALLKAWVAGGEQEEVAVKRGE